MTRLAPALALALVLAACGRQDPGVEDTVRAAVATGFGVEVPVTDVECPASVSIELDARFDCEVSFRGGLTDTVHVEVRADRKVHVQLGSDVAFGPELSATVARRIEADEGHAVEADCGADMVAIGRARCTITAGGKPAGVVRVLRLGELVATVPADSAAAERILRHFMAKHVGPVDDVSCTPVGELVGGVVTCDVRLVSGARTTGRHTIVANETSFAFELDPPVLDLGDLARRLSEMASPGSEVTIDCGKGAVIEPADGIVCDVVADGERGRVRGRRGDDGRYKLERMP